MSTLYITEYSLASNYGNGVPTGQEPGVNQTVAIGGGSTASSAFAAASRFVRLHTDVICSVRFGISPVATTSDARMAANQTEFFGVIAGHQVAVISNT